MANEKNNVKTADYFRISEEYWHDHYLIPAVNYCAYHSKCNEYKVNSFDCCKHFTVRGWR